LVESPVVVFLRCCNFNRQENSGHRLVRKHIPGYLYSSAVLVGAPKFPSLERGVKNAAKGELFSLIERVEVDVMFTAELRLPVSD